MAKVSKKQIAQTRDRQKRKFKRRLSNHSPLDEEILVTSQMIDEKIINSKISKLLQCFPSHHCHTFSFPKPNSFKGAKFPGIPLKTDISWLSPRQQELHSNLNLTEELELFAHYISLTEAETLCRQFILKELQECVSSKWSDVTLHPFGSFASGLSTFEGDIDVSVSEVAAKSKQHSDVSLEEVEGGSGMISTEVLREAETLSRPLKLSKRSLKSVSIVDTLVSFLTELRSQSSSPSSPLSLSLSSLCGLFFARFGVKLGSPLRKELGPKLGLKQGKAALIRHLLVLVPGVRIEVERVGKRGRVEEKEDPNEVSGAGHKVTVIFDPCLVPGQRDSEINGEEEEGGEEEDEEEVQGEEEEEREGDELGNEEEEFDGEEEEGGVSWELSYRPPFVKEGGGEKDNNKRRRSILTLEAEEEERLEELKGRRQREGEESELQNEGQEEGFSEDFDTDSEEGEGEGGGLPSDLEVHVTGLPSVPLPPPPSACFPSSDQGPGLAGRWEGSWLKLMVSKKEKRGGMEEGDAEGLSAVTSQLLVKERRARRELGTEKESEVKEKRRNQQNQLRALFITLKTLGWVSSCEFRAAARVPIISLQHCSGVGVDLSVGLVSLQASRIVRRARDGLGRGGGDEEMEPTPSLSERSPRSRVFLCLTHFLKVLLAQQGLDKPFTGGLGSFKLYLMVGIVLDLIEGKASGVAGGGRRGGGISKSRSSSTESGESEEDGFIPLRGSWEELEGEEGDEWRMEAGPALLLFLKHFSQPINLNASTFLRLPMSPEAGAEPDVESQVGKGAEDIQRLFMQALSALSSGLKEREERSQELSSEEGKDKSKGPLSRKVSWSLLSRVVDAGRLSRERVKAREKCELEGKVRIEGKAGEEEKGVCRRASKLLSLLCSLALPGEDPLTLEDVQIHSPSLLIRLRSFCFSTLNFDPLHSRLRLKLDSKAGSEGPRSPVEKGSNPLVIHSHFSSPASPLKSQSAVFTPRGVVGREIGNDLRRREERERREAGGHNQQLKGRGKLVPATSLKGEKGEVIFPPLEEREFSEKSTGKREKGQGKGRGREVVISSQSPPRPLHFLRSFEPSPERNGDEYSRREETSREKERERGRGQGRGKGVRGGGGGGGKGRGMKGKGGVKGGSPLEDFIQSKKKKKNNFK